MDDNNYIKQELKPFHITGQVIDDEVCTYYNAPIRRCRVENCKTGTEHMSFITGYADWFRMCLFSTIVFDLIIVDFDLSLPVGDKFSSQLLVELSVCYWA